MNINAVDSINHKVVGEQESHHHESSKVCVFGRRWQHFVVTTEVNKDDRNKIEISRCRKLILMRALLFWRFNE